MAALGCSWKKHLPQQSNGIRLEIEKVIKWGRMRTVSVLNSCENYTRRKKGQKRVNIYIIRIPKEQKPDDETQYLKESGKKCS